MNKQVSPRQVFEALQQVRQSNPVPADLQGLVYEPPANWEEIDERDMLLFAQMAQKLNLVYQEFEVNG